MITRYPFWMKLTFMLISVILLFYGIIIARDFLYPLVLAILFGYLLYPISNFMEKNGVPRIPASLLSILLFILVVTLGIVIIYNQAGKIIDHLPAYKHRALINIDKLESGIEEQFGLRDLRLVDFVRGRIKYFFEAGSDVLNNVFSSAAGAVISLLILPVYIFLFLYYRTKLAYFILQVIKKENRKIGVKVLREFSTVVAKYMGGISTVVIILAFLNSMGLLMLGIENPFIFGILSACFSFIPYFGTFIGATIPFSFALLTYDSPLMALKVALMYWIIHMIENNILTPNIVGNNLRINPMVIIIGVIAGGMIWGIPGMFATVPALAMFNIFSENVPKLQPYSFLFGTRGTRKHALTGENIRKFWDRITTVRKKIGKK